MTLCVQKGLRWPTYMRRFHGPQQVLCNALPAQFPVHQRPVGQRTTHVQSVGGYNFAPGIASSQ